MILSSFTKNEKITLAAFAGGAFLLHCIINLTSAYGFFRDELYYIACSEHLAWGYVDQPPFSIFLLKLSRWIFGDSLAAIRFVPALVHAGTVFVTGIIIKEMNGKWFAIFIGCLAVVVSPIHQGMASIYSMNSIDILIWALSFYLMLKIINTEHQSYWIALGIVLGIGLLNKISVLFLGAGIFTGILFTSRQWLTTRWPYLSGLLALLLFLPYVIWNMNHDLAHLEFIRNASEGKYASRSYADFIVDQVLQLNPITLPLWICGLLALFLYTPLKKFRLLGWMYLTAFLILLINRTSKGEYIAPAYVILFSAGGIFLEQKLNGRFLYWVRYAYPFVLVISFIGLMPLIMPVLPVERYIAYAKEIGMEPSSSENKQLAELPQHYADMFGWEEKARDVATVFETLSPEDQMKCAIVSSNYGRCGAIDFFGERYGLPKSIGTHNNYWIWGPGDYTGEVLLILGGEKSDHENDFNSVELAGVSSCQYCMPYENNVNIFICRGLKYPVKDIWPHEKHYD
ncbi:MAG: glycosyltransferase family 39 protein [Cyclobacteriaceae bacterium]|nr:glycosyltransferase family 39 protein [Cyclobacteriaceae bacterium]